MLTKEYRIPMPLSVEEYKIGQLYMIAKHSHEQSDDGEGVEVVQNVPINDPEYGSGQFTEKRIHLSSRLPSWIRSLIPKLFYITEKAWNYYPFTITEYTCSFMPKFSIHIKTRYENNAGTSDNCLKLSAEELESQAVDMVDIVVDEVSAKHYKPEEDLRHFTSEKTGRGPLAEDWIAKASPIMCSYKLVSVAFDVWGLQSRVEDYAQKVIREVLLVGHRQAVAWMDQWFDMDEAAVRDYEKRMQQATNDKLHLHSNDTRNSSGSASPSLSPLPSPKTPIEGKSQKSWFSWS